jgi:hypothetical protein
MKRTLFLVITLLALTASTFAQKPSAESIKKRMSLGFGVFTDFWLGVPDSIDPRGFNQGIDAFIHYSFPMDKKGQLAFFIGGGIGVHNFYNQALLGVGKYNIYEKPLINDPKRQSESYFYNVPRKFNGTPIDLVKSKLALTYIDVPFGFQFKARNKAHGTVGFKVGWNVNAHTKYKGTSLDGSGLEVVEKSLKLSNIDDFRYGLFAVIGYKWAGASIFYQLSSVFEKDLGPQIHPLSVGLVFKPF